MEKIRIAEKSLLDQFRAVFDPLQRHSFLAKIPYFNYQINFQSSHLTKKETEDASKRLSSYCMGALNFLECPELKILEFFKLNIDKIFQIGNFFKCSKIQIFEIFRLQIFEIFQIALLLQFSKLHYLEFSQFFKLVFWNCSN